MLCVFIVEMESVVGEVSTQLLELARRQRMNTDVRKNIFCVIMSSQVCVWEYWYTFAVYLNTSTRLQYIWILVHICSIVEY